MKRIVSIFSCALLLVTAASCSWFKLDNQEGWDAKVQGKIIDIATGEPVQSEQGRYIYVVEKGWDAEANQGWRIKNNGTYRNDLVFAGDYVMNTVSGANFVAEPQSFTLKKGDNTVDFKVSPFVTVSNVSVSIEGGKIKATCSVKANFPIDKINNIGTVALCVYPDRFVKISANKCGSDPEAVVKNLDPSVVQNVTLFVDPTLDVNADEFQYDRPHYVRIAAIGAHYDIVPEWDEAEWIDWDAFAAAGYQWDDSFYHPAVHHPAEYAPDGQFNPSGAYNYSVVYKVDLKAGTVTEVTDW
jgi:hypothetical protein